jgi:glycosyltransferase involved in cell wall biosynthesis
MIEYNFAIVAIAPIPLDGVDRIEGAGIRAWNLANGLSQHQKRTLLLYPDKKSGQVKHISNLVTAKSYSNNNELIDLCKQTEVLIGHGSHWPSISLLIEHKLRNQILISDMYVPIQVEYAARSLSKDGGFVQNDYNFISQMVKDVIRNSDYLLCAGSNQVNYYRGIMVSLVTEEPHLVYENRIFNTPHGYNSDSNVLSKNIEDGKFHIAWVGAFYPWMDSKNALSLLHELSELDNVTVHVVGPKNPFINDLEQIQKSSLKANKVLNSNQNIELLGWAPYSELESIYSKFDAVIQLNESTTESDLSWRTRLIDSIRFGVPIFTDGLDAISKELLALSSAFEITPKNSQQQLNEIKSLIQNPQKYQEVRNNLIKNRVAFSAKNFTVIIAGSKLESRHILLHSENVKKPLGRRSIYLKVKTLHALIKQRELNTVYYLIRVKLNNFLALTNLRSTFKYFLKVFLKISTGKKRSQIQIIASEPRIGGANIVALELYYELLKQGKQVSFCVTLPSKLEEIPSNPFSKIKLKKYNLLSISHPKYYVLNSIYHSRAVIESLNLVLSYFPERRLVFWIHEDHLESFVEDNSKLMSLRTLINNYSQVIVATPSIGTAHKISSYFGYPLPNIKILKYPLQTINSSALEYARDKSKFENLRFYISGRTFDKRKNHDLILEIFRRVEELWQPQYRNFKLVFIGVSDDPYSRYLIQEGAKSLKNHFEWHPLVNPEDALKIMASCDVCLNVSKFETLPRYVNEALALGHPIIRNGSSGALEQIKDKFNGFLVNEENVEESAKKILNFLDYSVITDDEILKMGINSRKIFEKQMTEQLVELEYVTGFLDGR